MSTNNPKSSSKHSSAKFASSSASNNLTQSQHQQQHLSPLSSSSSSLKASPSPSLSSHLAMVELKQRILTSLSKLSDRDTHQIAVEDLHSIIASLAPESLPMLLNCLYDSSSSDVRPAVKKESVRLLALAATSHPDPAAAHLPKIISHIARRLKDADSALRDAARDAIASLASQYLRADGEAVALFVRPLFEVMAEQNKAVQGGAAMCLAKMVESARETPVAAFQKLCPRICKYLANPNFLAKAAVLSVVSSLSQVGAISPQSLTTLMQSIHGCLENSDWATRKAAADTLFAMASHSSHLVSDSAASTIAVLEACRFDKVKPVRDRMTEALQEWKKIVHKGDEVSDDAKAIAPHDSKATAPLERVEPDKSTSTDNKSVSLVKDSPTSSALIFDSLSKAKGGSISEKAAGILKKKAPALTDKEPNPEFFQKLETMGSGDLPVEVVLPRHYLQSSHSRGDESELNNSDARGTLSNSMGLHDELNNTRDSIPVRRADAFTNKLQDIDEYGQEKWAEHRLLRGKDLKARAALDAEERFEMNQRDGTGTRVGFSRNDGHPEGHKGNWLAIQRQLLQLERQQANLMAMLQDFMGGSHDSMVSLENRVRGLERVVEDMARDLALSSGRRGSNLMVGFDAASGRTLGKYIGLSDYSSSKLGRGCDGQIPFTERFHQSDVIASGVRGRDFSWRSDLNDAFDSYAYGPSRNGQANSRRTFSAASSDGRSPRSEVESDMVGNRRAWDKGTGPRLGEGPSARSVWQASKDEATLEAIRVAGEDNGTSRAATKVVNRQLDAEALADDNSRPERSPLWTSWSHAMDALHVGDMDSAYAEVLSTGDDLLLVKLMDRSGPVVDQLSNEVASEVLHAVGQFLLEQSSIDIGLSWIQQLTELVMENGPNFMGIPIDVKRDILLCLHEASGMELLEEWEGASPDQIMLQLASAWGIDLQHLEK